MIACLSYIHSYIYIYTHFQKRSNLNIPTYEICTFSFRIKKMMDDACLYIYIYIYIVLSDERLGAKKNEQNVFCFARQSRDLALLLNSEIIKLL